MSARDELLAAMDPALYTDSYYGDMFRGDHSRATLADAILAAGYRKPRTITTAEELEALPFGSAVQTSDDSDTVVLKCERNGFRNQSGADLYASDLWRYGTHPFTVIYEPEPTK